MNIRKAFCWPIIYCIVFFFGCSQSDDESVANNDDDIILTIEQNADTILFKITCSNDIYIPHAAFSLPPYLSGPWELYYRNEGTDTWSALRISDRCAGPRCDTPCDESSVACDAPLTPPYCESISGEDDLTWDKMYVAVKKRLCEDGVERSCYEFNAAEFGEYKMVFSYRTEPCLTYYEDNLYFEKDGFFYEDIKTIEKEFSIQ